jgi:hypothetical protein
VGEWSQKAIDNYYTSQLTESSKYLGLVFCSLMKIKFNSSVIFIVFD